MHDPGRAAVLIRAAAAVMLATTMALLATRSGGAGLPWALALLPWTLALPMWPWNRAWPLAARACSIGLLAAAALLMAIEGRLGSLAIPLFIALMAVSARLPRPFPLVAYAALSAAACVPAALAPDPWRNLAPMALGLAAAAILIEGFVRLRNAYEERGKLLDMLIESQRRLEGRPAAPAEAQGSASIPTAAAELPRLTLRDREVLSLIASGFSNKEIAARLYLAEGTVKNRVSLILEKIGARDRTQAALRARDLHLL